MQSLELGEAWETEVFLQTRGRQRTWGRGRCSGKAPQGPARLRNHVNITAYHLSKPWGSPLLGSPGQGSGEHRLAPLRMVSHVPCAGTMMALKVGDGAWASDICDEGESKWNLN